MKMKKWTIGVLVMVGLLIGGLLGGIVLAGQPGRAAAAPGAQTTDQCAEDDDSAEAADTEDIDNVEEEVECGPQDENETDEANEANEVDESDEVSPTGLGLSADQAQAIVEKANPGVATLAVEFDRENGTDIWEVELDNGLDVKVDANSGQVLLSETRD